MNSFKKPHLFFLLSIPVLLLFGVLNRDEIVTINIHDTYFIADFLMLVILVSFFFGLIGFGYWASIRRNHKLSIWLNMTHVLLTIGGLLIVWVLSLLIKEPGTKSISQDLDYKQNLKFIMFGTFVISILGQVVYFINIARGVILKHQSLKS